MRRPNPQCFALLLWPFVAVSCACATGSALAADAAVDHAPLVAAARRAGLRVLEGRHLIFVTDRPARAGDGVDELPDVFDAAWSSWCRHFDLDPREHAAWRAVGCLVVDRERFRAAGLLPDEIPDFANGYCFRDRFWLADQSNPEYRRHLLLHEGVHAFTITLRDLAAPPWYTEGIAELLATHRLAPATSGSPATSAEQPAGSFVPTPIPQRAGDVEQLGRIERLRHLRKAEECPGLAEVLATPASRHRDLSAYAGSWAAVALFALHPRHAAAFQAVERGPLDATFTDRLFGTAGFDADLAARDFDAFTDDLDYGYDFTRSAIDWAPGRPLDGRRVVDVQSGRGWQNSGWSLRKGERASLSAGGRCTIGVLPPRGTSPGVRLETEPAGISLRWYRGRPLGRLLVAQWVDEPPGGGRPRFVVLVEGAGGGFTAAADGPLHCKLNEPPGELADDEGCLEAEFRLEP